MGLSISKLAVVVTAGVDGLQGGLKVASKAVDGFASRFLSAKNMIVAAGGAIAGAIAAWGVSSAIQGQMQAIDNTAKLADSLGVAAESYSRLQYAASYAGASNEDLAAGLGKMLKNLSDAQEGTGSAAEALRVMGLDASKLVNMRPEEAMGAIADGLNSIENPAQRAAAAQAIFGKGAIKLMPLLSGGSEGLSSMSEEADKLGYSFDRIEAAQIEAANDSLQKISNVLTGVVNQLAIKLAPFIEAAANKLTDLATRGDGLAGVVNTAFETVVLAVAKVTNWLDLLKAGFKFLQAGAALAIGGLLKSIDYLGAGLVKILNLLPGVELEWTETISAMADGVLDEAAKLSQEGKVAFGNFVDGSRSRATTQFFDELRNKSHSAAESMVGAKGKMSDFVDGIEEGAKRLEKVNDILTKLREEVATFGMSKGQKLAAELQGLGASGDQINEAMGLQKQLDEMERVKKSQEDMAKAADELFEATRTPAEKYAAELERINELLIKGAISEETANRAASKARTDMLGDGEKRDDTGGPKLLQAGSQEAARFVAQIQRRQGQDEQGKRMLVVQERQLDIQRQTLEAIKGSSGETDTFAVAVIA